MNITITGHVIHGDNYGKVLGFPTANLDRRQYIREKMKIRFGVYAGFAQILNLKSKILNPLGYKSAIVIGPLDSHRLPKIEAHLIGFKGNLYGKKISLNLGKYLRPFKKFKNLTALKAQIRKDLQKAKK